MPKWSDMLHSLIPWTRTDDKDARRVCAEAQAITDEQEALAPVICEMTEFLVARGKINGFTRQLQDGFARRHIGE